MENEKKYFNKNEVTVVGELVENGLELKETNAGDTIIAGPIFVKTVIDGEEEIFEFRLFSFQYKKGTTETSKLFTTYSNLDSKMNKKIKVVGNIAENRFYNDETNQLVSFNYNQGRFIYESKEDDKAIFVFNGYVEKPLHERVNKEGEPLYYEMTIAQANYNGTKPILGKFQVALDNSDAASYIESNYERGVTVSINGDLKVEVEKVVVEKEVAFGNPKVTEHVNTFKSYRITSGSEPVYGKFEYTTEDIRNFSKIYEEEAVKLQEEGKEKSKEDSKSSAKKTSASSLL